MRSHPWIHWDLLVNMHPALFIFKCHMMVMICGVRYFQDKINIKKKKKKKLFPVTGRSHTQTMGHADDSYFGPKET